MHIVQIAPPWYPIPPSSYGGIERVVADLTIALRHLGHTVTVIAPGDSTIGEPFHPNIEKGVGLDLSLADKQRIMAETADRSWEIARSLDADIIHDHTETLAPRIADIPVVRTIHGSANEASVKSASRLTARGESLIAISASQRAHYVTAAERLGHPPIRFAGVCHNPVDTASLQYFGPDQVEPYLAFIGRCHWEKDPAAAIRIAVAVDMPLKMALRVSTEERPYFEAVIQPLLEEHPDIVEYVGEVGGDARRDLMGLASAVLFTSIWEEPFGLVLAEANAHGTPVAAIARGSVNEVVQEGISGIICTNEQEIIERLPEALELDRVAIRAYAVARFDRAAIARQHVRVYERVMADHRRRRRLGVLAEPQSSLGHVRATGNR